MFEKGANEFAKSGIIVPLLKKGGTSDANNYRGVLELAHLLLGMHQVGGARARGFGLKKIALPFFYHYPSCTTQL